MGIHTELLILIDGVRVKSIVMLEDLVNPGDVESIEFMKSGGIYASVYGIRGAGGVLLITTRKGPNREVDTTAAKNRKYLALPVYTARQFHSPQYNGSNTQIKANDTNSKIISDTGNFNKTRTLKEVEIKDYRPKNKLGANSRSDNLNGPGNADYVLTRKDVEKCADLSCLESLLPLAANNFSHMGIHTEVMLLIDGMDVSYSLPKKTLLDAVTSMVSPNDIESIEFMKGGGGYAATYGLRGAGGVLLVTTRKGSDKETDTTTAKNRKYISLPIYMARQFYSSKYTTPTPTTKGVDLRTTVYWNPEIITDKDGKAKVQFYNNDVPGNYRITIEGITAKGILGRQVFNYKVE